MKVIKTSGEVIHYSVGGLLSFEDCQKAVGGYIVPLSLGRPQVHTILLNEDGDPMRLPFNPNASVLAGRRLVGDVVVLETLDEYNKVLGDDNDE